MNTKRWRPIGTLATLFLWCAAAPVGNGQAAEQTRAADAARRILELSGLHGGLAVHYDCGDGALILALGADGSWVVQGLARDGAQAVQCRRAIAAARPAGNVTVRLWRGRGLPYADNLVNLLIADSRTMPPLAEVLRVLVPGGVACVREADGWRTVVKPWPDGIDEWTHWLHAADGNPVARDRRAGPPRSIQWIDSPDWAKSHDAPPSLMAMVTAQGRLFYIADTSPPAIGDPEHQLESWRLCARDAFNGVLLWERPIEQWGSRAWSPGRLPADVGTPWAGRAYGGLGPWLGNPYLIHKRLVARGDPMYATLGFRAPVAELDAATGKTLRTFPGTAFADEIVIENGVLFAAVDRAAQRAGRYVAAPAKSVLAIDLDSGDVLWEQGEFGGVVDDKFRAFRGTLTRLNLTAGGGKLFLLDKQAVVAVDARSGERCWTAAVDASLLEPGPAPKLWDVRVPYSDLLYSDGVLYYWRLTASRGSPVPIELQAFSADDGSLLWSRSCGSSGFRSTFGIYKARGLVWALGAPAEPGRAQATYELWGMDPRSGEIVKRYNVDAVMKTTHHHRCYRDKATEQFIMFSRNGVELVDLETGEPNINRWVRGICAYGVMPANGLIYAPPQQCSCFPNAHLRGLIAYGGVRSRDPGRLVSDARRLQKGPAAGEQAAAPALTAEDWPAYRHDGLRSAATPVTLNRHLSRAWQSDLQEPVTAPTVGWGKVLLAGLRTHTVTALDAADGRRIWTFFADNRVDTPPTLWRGKAYFGTAGGYVYCLRADNGALVWRFDANAAHESIVVRANIESPWPVHGSVLVRGGVVYVAAGRSSYVDGGLRFYALDAETGRPLRFTAYETAEQESRQSGFDAGKPNNWLLQGAANDLLVGGPGALYLKNLRLDAGDLSVHPSVWQYVPFTKEQPWEKPFASSPLVCTGDFLDDALYDRTCYILDQRHSARKIAFTDELLVGLRWDESNSRMLLHNHFFELGRNRYTIFARSRGSGVGGAAARRRQPEPDLWAQAVDVRPAVLALAGDAVLVAGVPFPAGEGVSAEFARRSLSGELGAALVRLNLQDGVPSPVCKLPSPPVWDGVAVSKEGLFLTLQDGKVLALR